jgi:hypothetical protein
VEVGVRVRRGGRGGGLPTPNARLEPRQQRGEHGLDDQLYRSTALARHPVHHGMRINKHAHGLYTRAMRQQPTHRLPWTSTWILSVGPNCTRRGGGCTVGCACEHSGVAKGDTDTRGLQLYLLLTQVVGKHQLPQQHHGLPAHHQQRPHTHARTSLV